MEQPERPNLTLGRICTRWLVLVGVVALAFAFAFQVLRTVQSVQWRITDQYAVMETTDMIVDFWLRTGGKFPSSWEEMAPNFTSVDQGYGLGETGLSFLESRVHVEFALLHELSTPTQEDRRQLNAANFVWNRDNAGIESAVESPYVKEANQRIRELLRMEKPDYD